MRIERGQREKVLDILDRAYVPGEEFRGCWKKYSVKVSWMKPWCGIKSRVVRNEPEFMEGVVKVISEEVRDVAIGQLHHHAIMVYA